jgi:hypothetical protein
MFKMERFQRRTNMFRPDYKTSTGSVYFLCQIGGMISPDKKDSFRVIYPKKQADFKTCQSGTIFLFIKYPRQKKT